VTNLSYLPMGANAYVPGISRYVENTSGWSITSIDAQTQTRDLAVDKSGSVALL
jgi:hypothetical protein